MHDTRQDDTSASLAPFRAAARSLHRRAAAGDSAALERLRRLPELHGRDDAGLRASVQRRHAFALFAKELGMPGWPALRDVLLGATPDDFGKALYPGRCSAHWNIWSADYDEARGIREAHGGYLLAYRHHYLIVDRHYIETLGLDPDDPDWELAGRDWVRPRQPDARARLYAKLLGVETSAGPQAY